MFGRLDRYVARAVFGSYGATLLFVMVLWAVYDLLLGMSKYREAAERNDLGMFELLLVWLELQLVRVPLVFVIVAPFVTVIASMFAISRLMGSNEIGPMVFTGRSMMRILRPAVTVALLSAASMAAVWEFVLPPLAGSIQQLGSTLDNEDELPPRPLTLVSANRGQRLFATRYDAQRQRMHDVLVLDRGSGQGDHTVVTAQLADWNPERGVWELVDGKREVGDLSSPEAEVMLEGATPALVELVGKEADMASVLSYSDLVALRRMSPGRTDLEISFHYHFTWPLANVVLLLLALPFAVHFERGSKVGRVILAIAICAAYLIADLAFQNLGRGEFLHPVVAAWAPMIVFSSLGLVMFSSMRT